MLVILQFPIFCLTSVIAAIFLGFYCYFTRNFKFWQKLGIPYAKPTPFVGNLKECVLLKTTIGEQLHRIYNQNSDQPYVGIFSFDKPGLLIRDPELVKNILVKDFETFMDRIISFEETFDPLFSNNLGSLNGRLWRHLRTKLTPPFTSRKIKMMFYLVDFCGKELADCLEKATADGCTAEVKETMARFSSDVIASCAFGINCNSLKDPDAEFGRHIRSLCVFSVQKGLAMLLGFFAPYLNTIFRLKFVGDKTANYIRQIIWDTVEYREKHGLVRNDFLDSMIEMRKAGKDKALRDVKSENNSNTDETFKIDGDMFVAQAFVFMLAGYESSASTLSFALYELALHPEIQQSLRAEILQVLREHNGKLTYDSMQDISYLERVVSGMRFGLMQVKTGLCHILSRFEVATCKDTPGRIVFEPKSFLLQMKGGIQLSFNRL